MNHSTEEIARETVAGLFIELSELCDAMNDDRLASWELARQKAAELYHTMDTVCVQIQARNGYAPLPVPDMTRIYLERAPAIRVNHRERTAEPMTTREFLDKLPGFREAVAPDIPTETPEEAEEMDRIEQSHPTPGGLHPIFEGIIAGMRGRE